MIIPVGNLGQQELILVERRDGKTHETFICACVFVRLIGKEGW
jgi:protein-L-isoaspartate O-methyltransferase